MANWTNAAQIADDVGAIGPRVFRGLVAVVRAHTSLLRTTIIRNASTGHHAPGAPHIPGTGPGPNVATGDYTRSWTTKVSVGPTQISGEASTNAPQGRRLELGFVGVDSLGRHFDQAPFPHAGPAKDKIEPLLVAACAGVLEKEIR